MGVSSASTSGTSDPTTTKHQHHHIPSVPNLPSTTIIYVPHPGFSTEVPIGLSSLVDCLTIFFINDTWFRFLHQRVGEVNKVYLSRMGLYATCCIQ